MLFACWFPYLSPPYLPMRYPGIQGQRCMKSAVGFLDTRPTNDVMKRDLVSAGIPSVLHPSVTSRDDGKRPDGMSLVPWKCVLWDATCVDTLAVSNAPPMDMWRLELRKRSNTSSPIRVPGRTPLSIIFLSVILYNAFNGGDARPLTLGGAVSQAYAFQYCRRLTCILVAPGHFTEQISDRIYIWLKVIDRKDNWQICCSF